MVRSTFFALGLFTAMCGASFLVVDKFVLNVKSKSLKKQEGVRALFVSVTPDRQQVFDPPQWFAFSMMSAGSVTMLYSIALPKKGKKDEGGGP
jgi:hypothetical protein